jgi:riboflavin synthase
MFTGIVEEVARVERFTHSGPTAALEIEAIRVAGDLRIGDSIAVNGVCLTVRKQRAQTFMAELSQETLHRSSLGALKPGSFVNLERPLAANARLGGHFVQGHVDGVGEVFVMHIENGFATAEFSLPLGLRRYVVEKGSIAVDGISLTVAALKRDSFQAALIPHTLENTNLRTRCTGDRVNLECDILAKYVESLLKGDPTMPSNPCLTERYLKEQGY